MTVRRPFIAGNWKMNLNRADAVALAHGIKEAIGDPGNIDVALCPPFVYLDSVGAALAGSPISSSTTQIRLVTPTPTRTRTGSRTASILCL